MSEENLPLPVDKREKPIFGVALADKHLSSANQPPIGNQRPMRRNVFEPRKLRFLVLPIGLEA
jgi:hypothetical protein